MRRFKKRRSTVRWLPDYSGFSQGFTHQLGGPDTISPTSSQKIIMDNEGNSGVPQGLFGSNFNRTMQDSLILDHIKGKVCWSINPNSNGAGTPADADGSWQYFIRTAIVIVGTVTRNLTGTPAPQNLTDAAGDNLLSLDPGAAAPLPNFGSFVPDGVRFLWRRNWHVLVTWTSGANDGNTPLSAEYTSPPGPYVDIKPKRLLRPDEQLLFVAQTTSVGLGTASGTSAVIYWPDLRIAAHNTTRRR